MKKLLNMKKLTYIALMIAAVCSVGCKSDVFYETDVTATPIVRLYATNTMDTYTIDEVVVDDEGVSTTIVGPEVIDRTVDGVDDVMCTIVDEASDAPQYYNYYYETNEMYFFSSTYVIKDSAHVTKVADPGVIANVIKGSLTDAVLGTEHEYTGIEVSFYRDEPMILRDADGDPVDSDGDKITDPTADSPFVYVEDATSTDDAKGYKNESVKYVLRAESCTYTVGDDNGEPYYYNVGSETGAVEVRRVSPYNNVTGTECTFDESSVLMCPPSEGVQFEYKQRFID